MSKGDGMRVLLTGDSMIMRRQILSEDPGAIELRAILDGVDVRFTNLEVVPNDFAGDPIPSDGGLHLGARSSVLDEINDLGFNLLSAANNHALDYGIAGLRVAIRNLEQRGSNYAGIGHNLAEARRPAYVDTSKGSCALVACTTSFRPGQEAGPQREDAPGRPGLSHIGIDTLHEVGAETLETLRSLGHQLGYDEERKSLLELGIDQDSATDGAHDDVYAFNCRFRSGDQVRTIKSYRTQDVADVIDWLGEAKRRANIVIFSIHSHEPAAAGGLPADSLRDLCRLAATSGANVVAVHGSHTMRGVELHHGVPIFYGLGNFIAQNELAERFPEDSYRLFGLPPGSRPSDVPNARSHNETRGFPVIQECWESVMPICTFDSGVLTQIEVFPLALGFGTPISDRGKPRIAQGEAGKEILERFSKLSNTFGTDAHIEGDRAFIPP